VFSFFQRQFDQLSSRRGLDQLGSVLKQFHTAVTEMTGLVGGTVLVGPIPKEGGKIGTQR
jgi:uncharacterized membrane protein